MQSQSLRKKHKAFIYHSYDYQLQDNDLILKFKFELTPGIFFSPTTTIHNVNREIFDRRSSGFIDNMVFHLGLMEIPSYWKSACSPMIIIRAGVIDDIQIRWWKNLIINGLGEFFFRNKIDFSSEDFLNFRIETPKTAAFTSVDVHPETNTVLIPVGGGKDSPVTLETLTSNSISVRCLSLNAPESAVDIIDIANCQNPIHVTRMIDQQLLQLNSNGYLNGHTPISAYIAFLSTFCAALFGYRAVAISNERSSNEGNVTYLGQTVNHQYSKTFEFEQAFRHYLHDYIVRDIEYFSFLRPLYEIQIARIFSSLPKYFKKFRSCNVGQKSNTWCGKCPKCLFVYITLLPFLDQQILIDIFSHNLLEDPDLESVALSLLGIGDHKPFECVGTHEESLVAYYLCKEKLVKLGEELPYVLDLIDRMYLINETELPQRAKKLLGAWNLDHFLPDDLSEMLQQQVEANP
ncbi:MAG: hypothetical protein K8L99_25390 [Anaerolineae bacterium]|nr:hypothetical protein [Anaerolineae bacterium]